MDMGASTIPGQELNLTDQDMAYLQLISDPVLWAEKTMGWTARDYQAPILRDPSRRIVLRQGRRTGKTDVVVVKALYFAYIQPNRRGRRNYRILIVAPQDDHINEIFDRIRELIRMSEDLTESVVSDRKNPNRIVFGNKSQIRGLTAGTKSGRKALGARGKGADILIYDEMDYLDDDDIANTYAITQEHPDVFVIGASTPTGRRSWFYNWCKDPRIGFTEYHVPSTKSPEWGPEMERDLKLQFSGVKYLQEVMAEFGEEQAGVIGKRFIDAARVRGEEMGLRYQTIDNTFEPRGPRILGVDWDKIGAATHMVGLEFDRQSNLYYPIFYHEVPKHEYTLSSAVRQIVQIDQAFEWDYVIVDRGYGEMQVEELHRYGILHPESEFGEKVIGVSYQEHVDIRDPFTQKKIRQPLKPFMVNMLASAFEQNRFAVVPDDYKVVKALEDFRVHSVSHLRQVTYEDKDDHIFLSVAMAYYGFVKFFSDLINLKPATAVLPFRSPLADRPVSNQDRVTPVTNKGGAPVLVSPTLGNAVPSTRKRSALPSRSIAGVRQTLSRGIF